jgi:hypothetical protein
MLDPSHPHLEKAGEQAGTGRARKAGVQDLKLRCDGASAGPPGTSPRSPGLLPRGFGAGRPSQTLRSALATVERELPLTDSPGPPC